MEIRVNSSELKHHKDIVMEELRTLKDLSHQVNNYKSSLSPSNVYIDTCSAIYRSILDDIELLQESTNERAAFFDRVEEELNDVKGKISLILEEIESKQVK